MKSPRRTRSTHRRYAFTLVEPLIVVGIIAVPGSILLPSPWRAGRAAITAECFNNVRQSVTANQRYLNAYELALPFSRWENGIGPPDVRCS